MSTNMTDIRPISLAALQLSQTPAQKERRAHFDKTKLEELAESIKGVGVLQPIVVRPSPFREVEEELFEVVAGERRVEASKLAGLQEILASIRELDDHQVAKIQLIENLQREDVHPIAEAEGYDELLKKHSYTIEQLAAEVGKSKAYVYARIKLLALDHTCRLAFYRGELNASTALLIARIPGPVQRQACIDITSPQYRDEPMSYREAAEHIQRKFMLRLGDAPFPTGDAELLPKAGACGPCPKRTGNQPELFADIKGADVCIDPNCFKLKREAFAKAQIQEAKVSGQKVITGKEAKQIAPHGADSSLQGGYVNLDAKCYDDPKYRTYRQLVGKAVKPDLLQVPKSSDVIEVVQRSSITKILKEKGAVRVTPQQATSGNTAADRAAREKRQNEEAFRKQLLTEIRLKAPKQLDRLDLEGIALALSDTGYGYDEELFEILDLPQPSGTAYDRHQRAFVSHLKSITPAELNGLVLALMLRSEIDGQLEKKSEPLLATAKRLKIDPEKIRKELAAADKAKADAPAPAKASKKKARK